MMLGGIAVIALLGLVATWKFVLSPTPKSQPISQQITPKPESLAQNTLTPENKTDNPANVTPEVKTTPSGNPTTTTPATTNPQGSTPVRDRLQQAAQNVRENVQNREPVTRPSQPTTRPSNTQPPTTTPPVTEKPKEDPKPEPEETVGSFMVTVVGPDGEPLPATISTDLGSGYGNRKTFKGKAGTYSVAVTANGVTKNTSVRVVAGKTTTTTVRF